MQIGTQIHTLQLVTRFSLPCG